MPQYSEEGMKKTNEIVAFLQLLATKHDATPAQISLAWMINKKDYIIPIPGSRKINRLQENFDAGKIVLTKEEIQMIDEKLDSMTFMVFGGHSGK